MLDLDSLAEKRAKSANEGKDKWHQAVWSPGFQSISANMSDSEVELFLSACKSFVHLERVIVFLSARQSPSGPYTLMVEEAKRSGQSLSDWIAGLQA